MAQISNIYIDAGSTYSAIVNIRNGDGTPINLTNFTIAAQIRKSYGSLNAYNFTCSVFDAASGKVRMILPAATSSTIKPGRYLYDIEVTSPIGEKLRVIEGIVLITPEITKI
jgi:hypothetical protein